MCSISLVKYYSSMASIKSSKIVLPVGFQIEVSPGWTLSVARDTLPPKYTLTHGKKSMSFHSEVAKDLCQRNYSVRLALGRKQMVLPPSVLQAFVDFEETLKYLDSSLQ